MEKVWSHYTASKNLPKIKIEISCLFLIDFSDLKKINEITSILCIRLCCPLDLLERLTESPD